ncbi:MAG: DUF4863 family protein [Casimicrobiaceae bacterium]|nr:DUF4863 family protein [Casimicrobiaceae bacterium]
MDPNAFRLLIASVTQRLAGRPLDQDLEAWLNREYPPGSPLFEAIFSASREGIAAGWMCQREADGIRFGRVIKPGPETHGFSVDVVEMNDCIGPHHVHPNGEIDLVMPLSKEAVFDGQGAGWKVYGPGSDHFPTVRGGRARVLYLLPEGAIEFTGRAKP